MNAVYQAISIALVIVPLTGCQRTPTKSNSHRVLPNGIYTVKTGVCDVDNPSMNLRKSMLHEVRWDSIDAQQYTVIFQTTPPGPNPGPGTPFVDSNNNPVFRFAVPASGGIRSGVPGSSMGYFEYSINDSGGKECKNAKDPGLNVKP
jgi:hypothetical protein